MCHLVKAALNDFHPLLEQDSNMKKQHLKGHTVTVTPRKLAQFSEVSLTCFDQKHHRETEPLDSTINIQKELDKHLVM